MSIETTPKNLGKDADAELETSLAQIEAEFGDKENQDQVKNEVGAVDLYQIKPGSESEKLETVEPEMAGEDNKTDEIIETVEDGNGNFEVADDSSVKRENVLGEENKEIEGIDVDEESLQSYRGLINAQEKYLRAKSEESHLEKIWSKLGSKGNQEYLKKIEAAKQELEEKKAEFRKKFGSFGQSLVNEKKLELERSGMEAGDIRSELLNFMQTERMFATREKDKDGKELRRSISEEYNYRLSELDKIRIDSLSAKTKVVFRNAWNMYRKIPPKVRFAASLSLALGIGAAAGGLTVAAAGVITGKKIARWKIGAIVGAAGAGAAERSMAKIQSGRNLKLGKTTEDFQTRADTEFSVVTNKGLDDEMGSVVEKGLLVGVEKRKQILDEMNEHQKKQLRNRMIAAGITGAVTGYGTSVFAGGFLDSTLLENSDTANENAGGEPGELSGDAKIFKQWAKESNAEDLFSDEELNRMHIYGGREDIAHEMFEKKIKFRLLDKFAKETALEGEMENWVDDKGYNHVRAVNNGAVYEYVTDKNGKIINEKLDTSKLRAQWDSKNKMFKSVNDDELNSETKIKNPVVQSVQPLDSNTDAGSNLDNDVKGQPAISGGVENVPEKMPESTMKKVETGVIDSEIPQEPIGEVSEKVQIKRAAFGAVAAEAVSEKAEAENGKIFTLEKGDSVWKVLKADGLSDREIMNKVGAFSKQIGRQLMEEKEMTQQQSMDFINGRFSHMDIGENFSLDENGEIKCGSFLSENKLDQFEKGKWKIEQFEFEEKPVTIGDSGTEDPLSSGVAEKEAVQQIGPDEKLKSEIVLRTGFNPEREGFQNVFKMIPESLKGNPDLASAYTQIFAGSREEISQGLKDLFGLDEMPKWYTNDKGYFVVEDVYGKKGFNLVISQDSIGVDGPSKWNWGMETGKLLSEKPIAQLDVENIGQAREYIEVKSQQLKTGNMAYTEAGDEQEISKAARMEQPSELETGKIAQSVKTEDSVVKGGQETIGPQERAFNESLKQGFEKLKVDSGVLEKVNEKRTLEVFKHMKQNLDTTPERNTLDDKSFELMVKMINSRGGKMVRDDFGDYVEKYVQNRQAPLSKEEIDALANMYKKF